MEEALLGVPTRLIRPVRHGNAFEETIERLLQNIKLGLFGVGDKLPAERELSELLGVSRATLRDALAELQKAGYVEVRRGRSGGTYVSARRLGELRGAAGLDPAEVNDVARRGVAGGVAARGRGRRRGAGPAAAAMAEEVAAGS